MEASTKHAPGRWARSVGLLACIALIVIALIVVDSTGVAWGTRASGATFRARTDPSLIGSTVEGRWDLDDDRATLTLRGGHAFPTGSTSFVGTWTAPVSASQKAPSIRYAFDFLPLNDLGHLRRLRFMTRVRKEGGGRWSEWRTQVLPFDPQAHSISGQGKATEFMESPQPVQFQWRIRGRMSGPAAFMGEINLSISR